MTMIAERIPVIDTDTHVIEPPDLWTSRMPKKWGDRMPRVVFDEKWKMDRWLVGDRMLNHVAQYNASGWPEHPPAYPPSLEVSDPGGYDAVARLRKMDEFGLRAQVLYPNLIGFDTESFIALGDPE
ncbi:MAG: amidohydrolase, partial [Actinobacteria bacterium]|nr:amidohydrolase [Actinomycetota bacterium]